MQGIWKTGIEHEVHFIFLTLDTLERQETAAGTKTQRGVS